MGSSTQSYLIVGAGVFGVSTAYHLIQKYPHASVTLVDRDAYDADSRVAASWDWNKVVRADYDDLVYCRLLLTHLPDPLTALRQMAAAAGPRGRVVVEDLEHSAVFSEPASAALARYMDQSRSIPTATSFRTITVSTLDARRRELKAAGHRVSFTHLIAWAIVRAAE